MKHFYLKGEMFLAGIDASLRGCRKNQERSKRGKKTNILNGGS